MRIRGRQQRAAGAGHGMAGEPAGEQGLLFEVGWRGHKLAELYPEISNPARYAGVAISGGGSRGRTRLAWCTGAAQGFIEAAAERGVDAFVSGEISEPTFHLARELGIHYIAAGQHATERYGVQALGAEIVDRYGVRQQFIDIANPV